MMRALYPASNTFDALSDDLIALKIARHTPCSLCIDCSGLHPPSDVQILRDDLPPENSLTDLVQYGSDEEDNGFTYLRYCGCGHDPQLHGANEEELGKEEYIRRANIALRIDQHLEVRLPFWINLETLFVIQYARTSTSLLGAEFQLFVDRFPSF
jgi:histone acetyltransferase